MLRLWAGTTPCFALQAQPDGTALSRLRLPTQLSPASDSSDHETQGANFLHTGAAHNPTVNNFEDPFGHALEDGFDADPFGFNEDGFNEDGFNEDGTAFEDGFNDDGFNEDPFGFALEDFENAPQPAAASRCGDAAASSAAAPDFSASAPRTSRPRETSAFQDNTFEGCNSANPHNPAVGDRLLTTSSCGSSPVALGQSEIPEIQAERYPDASAPQLELAGFTLGEGHRIAHHRGLFWCWRCGAFGATLPRHLRLACKGQPARAGAGYLRRLRRGLPLAPERLAFGGGRGLL